MPSRQNGKQKRGSHNTAKKNKEEGEYCEGVRWESTHTNSKGWNTPNHDGIYSGRTEKWMKGATNKQTQRRQHRKKKQKEEVENNGKRGD